MELSEHPDELNPELGAAVRKDLQEKGFVTRWISIAEVLDEAGDKSLILSRGPSAAIIPVWDVRGMLYELLMNPDLLE